MSIANTVSNFEALGVYLWAEKDQLKFKAPAGVLTDNHKQELKSKKNELIEFLSDPVVEAIVPDLDNRYEPFPLTDLQVAYLVGRNNVIEYGGVGCHSYIELDLPPTDIDHLHIAWHALIGRHDMLRATVSQAGHQQILRNPVLPGIVHNDFRQQGADEVDRQMLGIRESLAHRCYQPDQWPQYELQLSNTDEGAILHFSIDLLIADFASIQILLAELGALYNAPEQALAPLTISYRDVVLARQSKGDNPKVQTRYERHKQYWLERINDMPMPPELPMAATQLQKTTSPLTDQDVEFKRYHFELTPQQWDKLRAKSTEHKITHSSLVLAAFTEILSRWSRHPSFCLNLTLLNRSTAHPDIRGVVGDFIEVNVLGVKPDPEQGFSQRALSLQQQLWRDLEHTDFSGIEVLREMSRQQQSNVIVPVVYTSTVGLSGDGLDANEFMHNAKLRYGITQTPQVWLDCQATERGNTLLLDWDVRQGIFQEGIIEQAHVAFCQLLEQLSEDDSLWQSTTPVPLPESMQTIRDQLNSYNPEYPVPEAHLHTGFCHHVLETPDAPAIISQSETLSYRELAKHVIAIQDIIRSNAQSSTHRVAIVMEKCHTQIAAVLGVLISDMTYVPIEISQPKARRDSIFEDAEIKLVLTTCAALQDDWPEGIDVIAVDNFNQQYPHQKYSNEAIKQVMQITLASHTKQRKSTAEKAAYIIYTSGSTGKPKGVVLSHQAGLNTVADINRRFQVTQNDVVLGLVSFGFDLSIWDIFGCFFAGATLVLPDNDKRSDPAHWAHLMEEHQVTLWNSVPAQMQMLVTCLEWETDIKLSKLRLAMLSGDWIPVALPDAIRSRCPEVQVISLGGPTETAIWCVNYPIGDVDPNAYSIPYGTPLSNHTIQIFNECLEHCPDWVTGEMYIGGSGLAIGYAGYPEKTAERFITHPKTGERLYRSGDLGRYRPDGIIEIQGRDDGQVKINGHRIELGEIEAAICSHKQVRSAAVIATQQSITLAAAVVPIQADAINKEVLTDELMVILNEKLPAYMIPSTLTVMTTLSLNANSKVDKKALHTLLSNNTAGDVDFAEPLETPIEQQMKTIWCELLSVESVSRNDNFFYMGGSSLTAINLLSAYLAEGYSADIDLIFNNPSFAEMAEALSASNEAKIQWLESIDLQTMADNALSGLADATPFNQQASVNSLLLTGASGYLGTYILNRLLNTTDYHIYCVIRCTDAEQGFERLRKAAEEKGLDNDIDHSRLTIMPGELSKPQLGVTDENYQCLCQNVDAIIHNASIINLMDPLSALYPTNVEGVPHILSLASTNKIKAVHYVSTIGVHHALPVDVPQPVVEATPVVDWHNVELTYEQSKIMAETLFTYARERDVPVNILRPGTVTWDDSTSDPFINDDAFLKFYRACLAIKAYPSSTLAVNIVPVNYVADCVAAITQSSTGKSENYHVVAQESSQVETLYQWFNALGCTIEPMEFNTWKEILEDNFVLSFVNLYFRHGMEDGGHHQYSTDNLNAVTNTYSIPGFTVTQEYLEPLTRQFNNADSQ